MHNRVLRSFRSATLALARQVSPVLEAATLDQMPESLEDLGTDYYERSDREHYCKRLIVQEIIRVRLAFLLRDNGEWDLSVLARNLSTVQSIEDALFDWQRVLEERVQRPGHGGVLSSQESNARNALASLRRIVQGTEAHYKQATHLARYGLHIGSSLRPVVTQRSIVAQNTGIYRQIAALSAREMDIGRHFLLQHHGKRALAEELAARIWPKNAAVPAI